MTLLDMVGYNCSVWHFDKKLLLFGWHLIKDLLPSLSVSLLFALTCIRFQWLRRILQQADTNWRFRLVTILFFGLFSVMGTQGGDIIDQGAWRIVPHDLFERKLLEKQQAIVGFRDTWALAAG